MINKRIFLWSYRTRQKHKNWGFHIEKVLQKSDFSLNLDSLYNKTQRQSVIETLQNVLFAEYKAEWKNKVTSNNSISRNNGGNKLCTYKLFKIVSETEQYVNIHTISRARRSSLAKFRCGVAPLRIETGLDEMLPYDMRNCFHCVTDVETEEHVLLECLSGII